MTSSRVVTAIVGIALSLLVSVLAWLYFDTFLLFFFVPFVPFLFRRRGGTDHPPRWVCPECGFATQDPEFAYCPRDGASLRENPGSD